jgi:hypothetical protein
MPEKLRQQTLQIASHPGKIVLHPLVQRYETHYHGKYRFARLVFMFDLFLVGLAAGLGMVALALWLWKPSSFADKIIFEADVAPREIVSGAPSTLVIRYTNNTGEELRNVKLSLDFPRHFLLLDLTSETVDDSSHMGQIVNIETLPVDGAGAVKIRGVMFGDVGGEQTFRSTMTFTHGQRDIADYKVSKHVFSPARSTLELALALPENIVAGQPIDGAITYRNSGEIDFPEIAIEPEWPDGFTLLSGFLSAPPVAAGTEGTIIFRGLMGETEGDATFVFHPSFVFGDDRYRQETLTHAAHVLPVPLNLGHTVEAETIRPGGSAQATIHYSNIGEETLTNVAVGVVTNSPFARCPCMKNVGTLAPGQTGSTTLSIPLLSSIPQSATDVYENIPFTTSAAGTFDTSYATGLTTKSGELTYVMTTPVVLDSFARYTAPSGDQLGRGPLPPFVDETTKYWVFWNVRGTTNEIKNVRLEGELGANVFFTGRQTVSQNGGVTYEAGGNEIVWTADSLAPTLAPSSKIIGVAFELALTPTADQTGTIPTLLKNIRLTGTDAVTGAFVSASGAAITTNLPNDPLAGGLSVVE